MKRYQEIVGDGGSDVIAQVTAQQQAIDAALAGVDRRVAVASGKGGVGKSTATMVLAQGLVASGRSVAILDADLNGPCQAQMAGLEGAPWVPGANGLVLPRRPDGLGVVSFGSFLERAATTNFATVASGDDHVWRATREFATLGQLVAAVDWGKLDVLLVDLPPGAERAAQFASFLGAETAFVVVTIPSDLARGVVARSVTALRGANARLLGYVENMVGYHHRETGEVLPLFPPSTDQRTLGEGDAPDSSFPCLGQLPFDPEMARWCDLGWPEGALEQSRIPGTRETVGNMLKALETT